MTSTQRIIKYLALAFALFLIVAILTTISKVGKAIVSHTKSDSDKKIEDVYIWTEETIINDLNIDATAFNIEIKTGDSFRVESSKKNIKCYVEDNILKISEKEHVVINSTPDRLIVTMPEDVTLGKTKISNGAGTLKILSLKTKDLDFDLAAGSITIDYLESEKAKIDSAAGKFTLKDGTIGKLDLDLAAGSATLTMALTADSKISAGVGELEVNLKGSKDDYALKLTKGVGTITVNGEKIKNDRVIGSGDTTLSITGGVGTIKVNNI